MGNHALTQRNKLQLGIVQPGVSPSGSPVAVPYTFPHVTPAWPSDTRNQEESHEWDGTYELVHDLNLATSYSEQTLVWERLRYSDMPILGEIALHGGVAATGSGPHVYTHDTGSTDDLSTVYTEVQTPYGASSEFTKTLQAGVCRSLVIEGSPDKPFLKATANIRGDLATKISSMTAASATGHPTRRIRNSWMNLYFDDVVGLIGSTLVECNRLAFKITIDNGIETTFTDCGATHGRGGRKVTVQLDMLLDAASASEWVHFNDGDVRYIGLQAEDPDDSDNELTYRIAGRTYAYNHGTQGKFEKVTLMVVATPASTWGYSLRQITSLSSFAALGCLIT